MEARSNNAQGINAGAPLVAAGTILDGRYEITAYVGSGGFASVYRARHIELGRDVAVKMMHASLTSDTETVKRFQREARIIAALHHPNICPVLAVGVGQTGLYMVTEYVEGRSLDKLIFDRGPLKPAAAMPLFLQICDAMSYAHRNHVLHRDLKPSNIVTQESPNTPPSAKVVDFGLARLLAGEDEQVLTKTGEVIGDPNYMSPEQCQGKKATRQSDIYSFGCLMYDVLTGQPPFAAETAVAILFKQISEEAKPMPAALKIPAALEAITFTAMEKEPSNRYESFEALSAVLKQYRDNPDVKIAPPCKRRKSTAKKARRRGVLYGMIAALCMISIGTLGYLSWDRQTQSAAEIARQERRFAKLSAAVMNSDRSLTEDQLRELIALAEKADNKPLLSRAKSLLAVMYINRHQNEGAYELATSMLNEPLPAAERYQLTLVAALAAESLSRDSEAEKLLEKVYQATPRQRGKGVTDLPAVTLASCKIRLRKHEEAAKLVDSFPVDWTVSDGKVNPLLQLKIAVSCRRNQEQKLRAELLSEKLSDWEKCQILSMYVTALSDLKDFKRCDKELQELWRLSNTTKDKNREKIQVWAALSQLRRDYRAGNGAAVVANGDELFRHLTHKPDSIEELRVLASLYCGQLEDRGQKWRAGIVRYHIGQYINSESKRKTNELSRQK